DSRARTECGHDRARSPYRSYLSRGPRPRPRTELVSALRRAACPGDILDLDAVDVHASRSLGHAGEHLLDRRRLALHEAQGVDAGDDEGSQVRALEAPLIEAADHRAERGATRRAGLGARLP